jgi:hypothetical protein
VHLKVTLAAPAPGGARRSDQGGIDHGASAQQQALALQQLVDGGEYLGARLLGFEQGRVPTAGSMVASGASRSPVCVFQQQVGTSSVLPPTPHGPKLSGDTTN